MEKYIYCPHCRALEIHCRATGDVVGWICQGCNPSLEEF